jgi:hypothetical protein
MSKQHAFTVTVTGCNNCPKFADAKQVANDCRIVADNAIAEAVSVKKDAARYHWLINYLVSDRTLIDDDIVACLSTYEVDILIDKAIQADCPHEIKASNGELFQLRCKKCGQNNPASKWCAPIAGAKK